MIEYLPYILFYSLCAIIMCSGILIFLTKNILYAAFLLLFTFLGIAGVYVFAGADFLAITQIVVYVGGILVLLMFGIMLTQKSPHLHLVDGQPQTQSIYFYTGVLLGVGLLWVFVKAIQSVDWQNIDWIQKAQNQEIAIQKSSIQSLGIHLMTDYILAFELIAILLLVALLGSVLLAGKKPL
jgi:NADH:ubiquinone oxidoreductase subunit 6 (subunit J)